MLRIISALMNDESGFIVSAELILIATICVLALIVGLSEVTFGINQELEDIGSAFGAVNQSFTYNGTAGHKGASSGSSYRDSRDSCDGDTDVVCNVGATSESTSWHY
jgi:Flp pilus assembly pilin Flp